jgi:hypothetical protein
MVDQENVMEDDGHADPRAKPGHDRKKDAAQQLSFGPALRISQNEGGNGNKDRRGEPERQPVSDEPDGERQAQRQHDRKAPALGRRHPGGAGGVAGERALPPGPRQHQRGEKDDGETEKERQETGHRIGRHILVLQAVHLPGAD